MSRIDDLIQEHCPERVEFRPVDELVKPVKKIKWSGENECKWYIDLGSVDHPTHLITQADVITSPNALGLNRLCRSTTCCSAP